MVQQTQPAVKQQPVQPVQKQTQPAVKQQTQQVMGQEPPVWKKWWVWLVIVLVVIGIGVGVYSWLS